MVNVLCLKMGGRRLYDIAIVTSAALPESIRHVAIWLPIFHPTQEGRRFTLNMQQGSLGH